MDREKFIQHLKNSGIPFTDAELETEADAAEKDDKAAGRRAILNSTKAAAPAVAESSPIINQAAAPIAAASAPASPAPAPLEGDAVTRVGRNMGKGGSLVVDAAGNAVQSGEDFLTRHPELYVLPAAYALNKIADKTGLYDTLRAKMSSPQPQPMVGGSGPRVAPSATPSASPIQNWDIHNDPSFGGFFGDVAAPAATIEAPLAKPSQNLSLTEATSRMAGVTPAAGEFVGPMQPVGPPEFIGPRRPIAPSAAPNSPATKAVTDTIQQLGQEESAIAGAAMPSRPITPTPTAVLPERVQNAIRGVPQSVQDQYAKEGKVVLKGYGVGDRSLTNTYGIPAYQKIIDYFNEGKPIGDDANYQIIRKKINQGVPASLAAEFAAKLPGSEAEAGNFGKAFGETGAYTKEGKVVTSPAAMKKAVAGGGALFLATALPNIVNAATSATRTGNVGPLVETAFDLGIGAIPYVGTAAAALTGSTLQSGKLFNENPYTEVLNRSGVRDVLANMRKTMSPDEFNVARDQYLSKLSSFPEYNSSRFIKPAIGSTQPINRRTLLPVAPPAR